jgi:hypothetical protein
MVTQKFKYCAVRKRYILTWADQSSQGRIKNQRTNQEREKGPPSFVLHKSPVASVSPVSRGHPSLVSLSKQIIFAFSQKLLAK